MPFNSVGRGAVIGWPTTTVGSNPINNRAFIDVEYSWRLSSLNTRVIYAATQTSAASSFCWGQVNSASLRDITKKHAMVCAFVMAAEYQGRFGKSSRTQVAECSP